MSKCWICGKEMKSTTGGCEHCPDCNVGITDLVFRPNSPATQFNNTQIYEQGWVCPKCGAVMSPRQMWCINCSGANETKTVGIDIQWEAKNE